jgi:subtilisin family serine protease
MSAGFRQAATLVAVVLVAGCLVSCNDEPSTPNTPTHLRIVSGSNQSADLASTLDSALVVQVLDAANRPVANVALSWNVTGGGSVSSPTTTSDGDGRSSVRWTLSAAPGTQVVTVTSPLLSGALVAFVANNGSMITGVVSAADANPFAAFSVSPRARRAAASLASSRTVTRRLSPDRIIIGFRDDKLGVAAAGSGAYRSLTTARQTVSRVQQSVSALARSLPIINPEVSPAMLAARVRVSDATEVERVMADLRSRPDVAWVERDEIVSIRDRAPRPTSAEWLKRFSDRALVAGQSARLADPRLPNDEHFYTQLWAANMIDLPRAWSVTTGAPSVTVAVVDMGIRFDHGDIAPNLTHDGYDFVSQIGYGEQQQICTGETFDTIDGDGDGPDADPTDPDDLFYDQFSGCWLRETLGDHGLWTAGIIGAVGNDGGGIAGVNWNVKIRPVRVLGITGDGTNFDIAQGVLYAAGLAAAGPNNMPVQAPSRAQIINLSLGGPSPSSALQSAVNAAYNAGSLIVASAGNDGLDFPSYPAAFSNVIGVSAVGQDGLLATYSNAGTFISVAAPGGDFRLDDNGGGGIIGPGWNFVTGQPTFLFGYGTSASAPFVSGIAALLLAQTPTLTPAALRSRIEQFARRPAGATRSDSYGWGIVNAYNSLTQSNGPPHMTMVRLLDATTGAIVRTTPAGPSGSFAFTRVRNGSYYVQAGDDESGDAVLGIPGRRYGWYGGFGAPTPVIVNNNSQAISFSLGMPTEVEPNDDVGRANFMVPNSYVVGNITTPDVSDTYSVLISTNGIYTFETTGLVGSCGLGVELDTFITLRDQTGTTLGTNNDFTSATSLFCSRLRANVSAGVYYITVRGTTANGLASHGRYRLQVRSGE